MAEKSSMHSTPERMKVLLSSFIHKDVDKDEKDVGCKNKTHEESTGESSRSYQPRNKEAYFARVASYSELKWFAKPIDLSPLRCAQYGWENTSKDVLKCVSCRQLLCATLPQIWDPEVYAKRCNELKEGLRKAHSNMCAWADSPSPDSFLSVPVVSHPDALNEFKRRLSSLSQLGTRLPVLDSQNIENEFNEIIRDTLDGVVNTLLRLTDVTTEDESGKSSVNRTACLLSLSGWTTSCTETSSCHTISCQFCNRQAGLWNFTQTHRTDTKATEQDGCEVVDSSSESADQDKIDEPVKKKFKFEDLSKKSFNPLTEHRLWCPWVMECPSGSDGQPNENKNLNGWKSLLSILVPSSASPSKNVQQLTNKQQTPPNVAWKAVRKIFNFLQTPSKKN